MHRVLRPELRRPAPVSPNGRLSEAASRCSVRCSLPMHRTRRRSPPMPTPRRNFLALLGLGALSTGLPEEVSASGSNGDLKPVDNKWDLSWTRKVKEAKWRAAFDSPAPGGNGL